MKIADSYFIDPDTGKQIPVLMRYTNSGDSIMQTSKNQFRIKNGKVEKLRDIDLWVEPNTEDPNYWSDNFKLAILNQSTPSGVLKYYWNKIFKKEQGGTMNYAQYLQEGGELEQPQVELSLGEKEVKSLVLAIINNGDEESAKILVENAIKDPENGWINDYIVGAKEAAEEGNEDARKFWDIVGPLLELALQAQSLKCGGRVRAKVKKASCGKKLEKGAKVPVEKKGGCPCQYRRVGGRIQLVDCNGIPVAKDGAVLKALLGKQLPTTLASDAVRNYMTAKQYSVGEVMDAIGNTFPAYRLWNKYYPSFVNRMNQWQNSLLQNNPSFWETPTTVKKVTTVETSQPAVGSEAWKAQQRANQEAYYKTPKGLEASAKADAAVKARQNVTETSNQTVPTTRSRGYFADNGFSELQSFAARKAWLLDPANADYIKALGFDANTYRGTEEQNKALLSMLLALKLYADDIRELEELNANLSRLTPSQMGFNPTVVTPDAMSARSPLNLSLNRKVTFSKAGGKFPYADYLK